MKLTFDLYANSTPVALQPLARREVSRRQRLWQRRRLVSVAPILRPVQPLYLTSLSHTHTKTYEYSLLTLSNRSLKRKLSEEEKREWPLVVSYFLKLAILNYIHKWATTQINLWLLLLKVPAIVTSFSSPIGQFTQNSLTISRIRYSLLLLKL